MNIRFCDNLTVLGSQVPFRDSLSQCMDTAVRHGMYAVVLNLNHSAAYRKRVESPDIVQASAKNARFPMYVFSYAESFNLCGSKRFLAWNGNASQDEKTVKQIDELEQEMGTLAKLGGGVILAKLGEYSNVKKGITAVTQSLDNIRFGKGFKLYVQNTLGIGKTFEELSAIITGIKKTSHVGIVLSPINFYVAGIYNVATEWGCTKMWEEYESFFGILPYAITISDTYGPFGCLEVDPRPLGDGVWRDTLRYMLDYCKQKQIIVLTHTLEDYIIIQKLSIS